MAKTVRIGTSQTYGGRKYSIYCQIRFGEDGNREPYLSISGVEGPLSSGNCLGGCGQIDMHKWEITQYAPGWNAGLEKRFREVWKEWHLKPFNTVPAEIVEFLQSLPETDRQPAWV